MFDLTHPSIDTSSSASTPYSIAYPPVVAAAVYRGLPSSNFFNLPTSIDEHSAFLQQNFCKLKNASFSSSSSELFSSRNYSEQYSTPPPPPYYSYPHSRPIHDSYSCQWIDPETQQMCQRTFSSMQEIGKVRTLFPSSIR